MDYVIVWASAAAASALTLPTGFGLGTILMPVFALFFPIDVAIAMTAVVHLFTNLFKFVLFGQFADRQLLVRFGIPAILGAFLGARLLFVLSGMRPLFSYAMDGHVFHVMAVKVVVAVLLVAFAFIEFMPRLRRISFSDSFLVIGGALTGFFGGLSGHQGALRSAFLINSGVSKETFIATGVVIGCLVDFSRISVYSAYFAGEGFAGNGVMLAGAIVAALLGAFAASRVVQKVTMRAVQMTVTVMLVTIAIALATGLV